MTTCPICLDEFPAKQNDGDSSSSEADCSPRLIVLPRCQHSFCEPCLQAHLADTIEGRRTSVVKCPFLTSCGESIDTDQVQETLSRNDDNPTLFTLWKRLHFRSQHPDYLECPYCDAAVPPTQASSTTSPNDIECSECHKVFCRLHGPSHPGRSCTDHDAAMAASEVLLSARTVPCSHCGARLQRSRGCSYVVCSACRNDMCYDCRTHVYLSEGRLRYCTKCSTALAGHGQASCAMNCVLLLLLLLVMLVWVGLALVLAVVTMGCCAGYCCGRGLKYHADGERWAPKRGCLAVLVTIFLPCLSGLESEEFVDQHLPFFLADLVADEIPVMSTSAPVDESPAVESSSTNVDLELGEVLGEVTA